MRDLSKVNIVYRDDGTELKVISDVCNCGKHIDDMNEIRFFRYAEKPGEYTPVCLEWDET